MSSSRPPFASLVGYGVVLVALCSLGGCDDDPAATMPPAVLAEGCRGATSDITEVQPSPQTLPPFALSESGEPAPLPPAVVLTNLPAVAQQGTADHPGSPGTCEAQSFGYGLGSYTAARLPDGGIKWDPADAVNSVSAAFLYALAVSDSLAGPCPKGGLALEYLARLTALGAPSRAQVPYEPNCNYLKSVDPDVAWPDQDRFLIGSYSTFRISTEPLEFIKRLLAARHAIAFTGPVYSGYADPTLDHGVFGTNTGTQPDTIIPNSGHGQLLVGYDDDKGDPSAPGAFLIQNSFGTDWPPSESNPEGRIWWAYRTFLESQELAAVAYPRAESAQQGKLQSELVGPEGFVTGVRHWVDPRDASNVYLIVELQFTEPVLLQSIVITEPTAGTEVQQEYDLPFSTGYVFTRRTDGAQFVNGIWPIQITVEYGHVTAEYVGTIDVGQSVPTTPPSMPAAAPMYGTMGTEATVIVDPSAAAGPLQ